MPITKALQINAAITRVMLYTLDKWRTLGRTDWNKELTRKRMESLSRWACFDRRKGILMARAVRGEARSVSIQRLGVFNRLNARPNQVPFGIRGRDCSSRSRRIHSR